MYLIVSIPDLCTLTYFRCFHVVSCWKSADLLALVCDVKLCFCHFPMWYLWSSVVLDCIDSLSLPIFLLKTYVSQYTCIKHICIAVLTHCLINKNPYSNQQIHVLFEHAFKFENALHVLKMGPKLFAYHNILKTLTRWIILAMMLFSRKHWY